MIIKRSVFYVCLVSMLVTSVLDAALQFSESTKSFESTDAAGSLTTQFEFVNESEQSIKIEEIRSSCGCTVADLQKRLYAPGESGSLEVRFEFGARVGPQKKEITVITDGDQKTSYGLTLKVNIEPTVVINPKLIRWKQGSEPESKTMRVKFTRPEEFEIADYGDLPAGFSREVTQAAAGELLIRFEPNSTKEAIFERIALTYRDRATGAERIEQIYLMVR